MQAATFYNNIDTRALQAYRNFMKLLPPRSDVPAVLKAGPLIATQNTWMGDLTDPTPAQGFGTGEDWAGRRNLREILLTERLPGRGIRGYLRSSTLKNQ